MNLSIIIVSWNVRDKLKENLKALYQSKGDFTFEIFVIDNNSQDASAEMVAQEFPAVKLIINNENVGLSRAIHQAKDKISGDFILLLNPDNQVLPDTLINMLQWMKKHEQAWVAGCRLIDEQGKTVNHVRRFPTLSDQLAIVLKLPHLFPKMLKKYLYEDFDYTQAAIVDSIRGAFFLIRKEATAKIGLWDTRYFIWFEEVDYCLQVKKAGGEVWYTPAAKCIDHVGQSFKQVDTLKKQRYIKESMLKYFKKWHPAWEYWILRLAWPIGMGITWLMAKAGIKSRAKT